MKIKTTQLRRTLAAAAGCCALSMIAAAPAHAALTSQLGILDLTANGGINPGTGEAWKYGDKYHLIYITTATTAATSTDIATYNAFVTADAASQTGAFANMGDVNWTALGSTVAVSAFANSPITGPVMAVSNSATVATGSADLWNFTWAVPVSGDVADIDLTRRGDFGQGAFSPLARLVALGEQQHAIADVGDQDPWFATAVEIDDS